jgi:hypothetical protein
LTALKSLVVAALLALLVIAPPADAAKKKPGRLVPSAVIAAKQRGGQIEIAFTFEVRNAGKGTQRSRNAYLALVQAGAPEDNLGQVTLPRLRAGESVSPEATLPIGPGTGPGTYLAQVCVRSVKVLRCARSAAATAARRGSASLPQRRARRPLGSPSATERPRRPCP